MAWLKDAYLDVLVLLLIAVFAVYTNNILEVVLWVYTGLLLLSKVIAFFMPALQKKADQTEAPPLFYHLIYALTIAIFLYIAKYYLAIAWAAIWLASFISSAKKTKKKS
ncbi:MULTISPECIES: hypothetical protein [Gracilimonas]|uniref:Uncharacterized protein n=1 Tax=Gracilimonas sediminicola TaxID=2952158 RepID=A0A9X2RFX0_9BACT|nr:hypothetical protein [Gracilimonas sediminicola]MCP9292855.1 hypothetical protein [Gracilimonas sediminicola]